MASIRQRGESWEARVRRTGHGVVCKSFPTKKEAERWARMVEHAQDRGRRAADPGRTTLGELIAVYAGQVAPTRASRSKMQALAAIGRELGAARLAKLDAAAFIAFARARRRAGAGPATVLQDLSYIGTVLRHAAVPAGVDASQAVEALAAARAVLAHGGQVARPLERTRRPSGAELAALFAHWQAHPPVLLPMADIVAFAVATGMRLGEITALEWAGMDDAARTVLIRDRKHPRQKRGNDQVVPLLDVTGYDAFAIALRQPRTGARIFPFRAASTSTAFTRAVAACGIRDLHFHDLRHEALSRMFEAGLSIEQVALCSGHRDWNMLRRYVQLGAAYVHEAAKAARPPALRVVA